MEDAAIVLVRVGFISTVLFSISIAIRGSSLGLFTMAAFRELSIRTYGIKEHFISCKGGVLVEIMLHFVSCFDDFTLGVLCFLHFVLGLGGGGGGGSGTASVVFATAFTGGFGAELCSAVFFLGPGFLPLLAGTTGTGLGSLAAFASFFFSDGFLPLRGFGGSAGVSDGSSVGG